MTARLAPAVLPAPWWGDAWGRASPWLQRLGLVALTVAVWHRALALYFSQDDFVYLARARGLVARLDGPWRWLSQQAAWDLTRPFGVESALPQHLLSLAVHVACVLLVHHLLSRRLSAAAAFVGAAFFATHPSAFHAVYWASAIADPLQLGFALAALGFGLRQDRACWFAVPMFALSLVSKEGLLLLPAVLLLHRLGPGAAALLRAAPAGPLRSPRRLELVLGAMAAVFLAYFVAVAYPRSFGAVTALGSAVTVRPYDIALGTNLLDNVVTYLGWTANLALPTVRAFADVPEPGLGPWSAIMAVAGVAGCAWPALRARGWVEGAGTYVAFLLPVLLLRDHTCHYYLYGAMAGASICVAAIGDLLLGGAAAASPARRTARSGGPRAARWPLAGAIVLALGINGALLVRKIELHPLGHAGHRADPVVDRAILARRTLESLRSSPPPTGASLVMWSPGGAPGVESYWTRNVQTALGGGVGLTVMAPWLAGATFVPAPRLPGPGEHLALLGTDGTFRLAGAALAESLVRAAPPVATLAVARTSPAPR